MSTYILKPKAPGSATATATSSTIVAADEGRVLTYVTNLDSSNSIYLAFGDNPAEANKGIPVAAGQTWWNDHNMKIDGLAVQAITASGSVNVAIQEFTGNG